MKLKKIGALAGAVALALSVSGNAAATVAAQAYIDMTNFEIKSYTLDDAGGVVIGGVISNGVEVNVTNTLNTTDITSELNGATDNASSNTINQNIGPVCVGSGCGAATAAISPDLYPMLPPPPTGNYVMSDTRDIGSPIGGVSDGAGGTLPTGATVSVGSWAGLETGTGAGTATANNGLSAEFIFTAQDAIGLVFEFDVRSYVEAFVSGDETAPSGAQAQISFNFLLTDLDDGSVDLFAVPLILNPPQVAVLAPTPGGADRTAAGVGYIVGTEFVQVDFQAFTVGLLDAGNQYSLSAAMNTRVDLTREVPVPGALALLGLGMVGLAGARRKSKRA